LARKGFRSWGAATSSRRARPDFLVIGAKRGGTTTLFRALQDHPDVLRLFPARGNTKSPHYFDDYYNRGPAWYRGHFPLIRTTTATTPRKLTGEASPYYLFHPLSAGRIAADLPDVKCIVMLRDPIERAFSHHWDRVKNGVETLSFEDAIAAEPERLAGERDRFLADPTYRGPAYEHFSYLARGRYAEQLAVWFDAIGRERILVLHSEDFYADPQAEFDRTLAFLGLAPHQREEFGRHHGNADRPTVASETRRELEAYFAPYNTALAELLGTENWWPGKATATATATADADADADATSPSTTAPIAS
jgi:Sulfotransferase domain